jgi:hypothetical protein
MALRKAWLAQAILAIAALIWLIPDRRIEKRLATKTVEKTQQRLVDSREAR